MKFLKDSTSTKKILFIIVLMAGVATLHFACNKTEDYPIKPDRLGSGKVKWVESQTPDGWTMVTNEEGATLGYSKSSGLQLIQADRYAFKDPDRSDDGYENESIRYKSHSHLA